MAENRNYFDLDAEEMASVGTAIKEALSGCLFDGEPAFEGVDFSDGSILYEVDAKAVVGGLVEMVGAHREAVVTQIKSDCPFIGKVDLKVEGSVLKVRCFVDESLADWETPERGRYDGVDMAFVAERAIASNDEATRRAREFLTDFVIHLRGANPEFDELIGRFENRTFEDQDGVGAPVMRPELFMSTQCDVDGDKISLYVTFITKHADVQRIIKDTLKDAGLDVHNEGDGVFVLDVPNEVFRLGLAAYLARRSVVAKTAAAVAAPHGLVPGETC